MHPDNNLRRYWWRFFLLQNNNWKIKLIISGVNTQIWEREKVDAP